MVYYRGKNIKYSSRGRLFMRKLNVSIIIISIILLLSLNTVYATSVGTTSTTNDISIKII